MKEEFRWIKGFEGYYMVSNLGRIYSFPRYDNMMRKHGGYFISTQISPNGYEIVHLMLNGKRIAKYVHKVLAESFIPNPIGKKEVDHIDANKTNNRIDNLRWCTRSENCLNEITYTRMVESNKDNLRCGDKNPHSRRVAQYDSNGNFIAEYESCGDAFRKTGISRDSIQQCASGKRKLGGSYIWKYITEAKFSTKKITPIFPQKKGVCQYSINGDFIKEYVSITEAAKSVNSSKSSIRQAIEKKGTSAGFFWKFKEQK